MKLYMKISKDKYELPEAVADTVAELAKMCGTNPMYIYSCLSHAKKKGFKSIYKKVVIEDGEEE